SLRISGDIDWYFPSEESFLKKEQLKNFMSTKTYDYWTRARNKCTDDVLMNSLFSNPCLLSVFENDNQLLDVYVNNAQGNLKDDVNVLCYLKNMNRFSVLWDSISKQKGIFDASNVHLVNDAIFEGNSSIGNIASSDGYTIRCANKKLLDLYPMGQTEYIKNSCTWKTDAQGRPIVANVIVQRIEKKKIDDEKMLCTQFIKTNFNVWGHSKKNEEQKSDCIFLLIPSFYGGECSFINQVVVDKSVLKTSKKIQKMVKKALKKNVSVKYEVIIDYPDNSTFRPKNVRFSLIENGVQTQTTLVKN
ncbi:MAG: hypothetical protein MJZ02_06400, partial [Paludibacteraceae bacterium]|nr:hypothetical protein [Paludibacteraceae bacterium]